MSGDHNQYQKGTSYLDLSKDGKEIELVISHDVKTGKTTTYDYRFGKVRELVKDGSLRVTDIAKQTGYNKGHVSRLKEKHMSKELMRMALTELQNARDHIWLRPTNEQALSDEEMLAEIRVAIAALADALKRKGT